MSKSQAMIAPERAGQTTQHQQDQDTTLRQVATQCVIANCAMRSFFSPAAVEASRHGFASVRRNCGASKRGRLSRNGHQPPDLWVARHMYTLCGPRDTCVCDFWLRGPMRPMWLARNLWSHTGSIL